MKTFLLNLLAGSLLLLALALTLLPAKAAVTSPPQLMSYQGYLTDANGIPLGSTNAGPKNYNVVFRVWDLQTGGVVSSSDELYAEQQTVTVNNGYFSVLLGQGLQYGSEPHAGTLSTVFFSTNTNPRYVEITVLGAGINQANITILPRQQLLSAPYAFLAANAVTAASAASLVNNNSIQVVTVTNGFVGIGTNSPATPLAVSGNTVLSGNVAVGGGVTVASNLVVSGSTSFSSGATVSSNLLVSGSVGIGTNAPATALEVNGDTTLDGVLSMKNSQVMTANNTNGTADNFLWPRWNDNVMYLNFGANGFDIRNNSSVHTMFMQPSGNVNIGNFGSYFNQPDQATLSLANPGNNVNLELCKPGSKIGYQIDVVSNILGNGLLICEHNVGCYRFFIQNGTGFIGIGTGSPNYPLDVENTTATSLSNYGYLNSSGNTGHGTTTGTFPFSIYAAGRVVAPEYETVSDLRIKQITGRSDTRQDLAAIRMLQITDYRKLDEIQFGGQLEKGVIAQEVEKILPEAVNQSTNFIPNIYARAASFVVTNQSLVVTLKKPHSLVVGDVVKLITGSGTVQSVVTAVPSPQCFSVAQLAKPPEFVFVYGKQVGDFRTVNYDRLYTIGISAIQELAKRMDSLDGRETKLEARETRLAALEQKVLQVTALNAQVAQLKAQLAAEQTQMADLKKLVVQLAEAAKNSKLTAHAGEGSPATVTTASLDR